MRKLKFRWCDAQGIHYRTIILPRGAQQMLYVDECGVEVYEDELVFDGEEQNTAEIIIYPDPKRDISLDAVELARAHGDTDWCGAKFIEHEPLYVTEAVAIQAQADALNDKLARDARLCFSKSVFDLLPDLSELRDVD